jgi:hypothetical protein
LTEKEVKIPWAVPTRQQQGRIRERKEAKKIGAKLHPNSGAGRIKHDASTAQELIEYKDANLTHQVKGSDLEELWQRAVAQGKDGKYVIYFSNGIVLDGLIRKG